jgi:hypothetical protein
MAQAVESLPNNFEVLSSNPSSTKMEKKIVNCFILSVVDTIFF